MEKIENQHLLIVLIVLILSFILKQQPKQEKDIVRKKIGNGLTTRKLYLLYAESYHVGKSSWIKVVVFCKCIVVFNETFISVGGSKDGKDKATGVLWHEGISL